MPTRNLGSFVEIVGALEGTDTGAWGWDPAIDTVRWSRNLGPLYGRERGFQPAGRTGWIALLHPDDRASVDEAIDTAVRTGEDAEIDARVVWPDGTLRWLSSRIHPVTDGSSTVVRIVGVTSDATRRRRREEQQRFLAEAAEMLAASSDVDGTLQRVASLVAEHLADWCTVQELDGGELRTRVVTHRDPAMRQLVRRLQEEYPPEPEPVGLTAKVIATGEPVLIDRITETMLLDAARDERHLDILRSLGLESALLVPMQARGTVVGVMSLISADPSLRLDEHDVSFAEQFARLAGLALDSARSLEESDRARRDAERTAGVLAALRDVIAAMSGAAGVEEVAAAAIEHGRAAVGAVRGSIVLGGPEDAAIVASTGYSRERLASFGESLRAAGPLRQALEAGTAVYCSSVGELLDRYPSLASVMEGVPPSAYSATPMVSRGRVIGAVGFVFAGEMGIPDDIRTLIESLTGHVAAAVERSTLFDESRTIAETLQTALAPMPVSDGGGIEVAAHYRPAGLGDVGGDWYEGIDGPSGERTFVVGDVVGRGLQAVASMAQLRHSLRMLVLEGHDPAAALQALGGSIAPEHAVPRVDGPVRHGASGFGQRAPRLGRASAAGPRRSRRGAGDPDAGPDRRWASTPTATSRPRSVSAPASGSSCTPTGSWSSGAGPSTSRSTRSAGCSPPPRGHPRRWRTPRSPST
jgi:GAF domain-containing protein